MAQQNVFRSKYKFFDGYHYFPAAPDEANVISLEEKGEDGLWRVVKDFISPELSTHPEFTNREPIRWVHYDGGVHPAVWNEGKMAYEIHIRHRIKKEELEFVSPGIMNALAEISKAICENTPDEYIRGACEGLAMAFPYSDISHAERSDQIHRILRHLLENESIT